MSKIDTRTWSIGYYPMPERKPLTDSELVAELRLFNHHVAAERLSVTTHLVADADRVRSSLSVWLTLATDGNSELPTVIDLANLRDWIDGGCVGDMPLPKQVYV